MVPLPHGPEAAGRTLFILGDTERFLFGIGRGMGDYVLKIYSALERLVERISAQNECPLPDAYIDAFGEDHEDQVQTAKTASQPHQIPGVLLEPRAERYEPEYVTPSPISPQFGVSAVRKKARHKKQSPRQIKRSLRKAECDAKKAEKASRKSAAADHRLEQALHNQKSFFGPTTKQWRVMVTPDLVRVSSAQRRFAMSASHSKAAMLAAADELDAATRDAMTWLAAHPCPDSNLADQVAGFINTCAVIAITSRSCVASPLVDTHSVMSRMGALLSVVDRQVQKLVVWERGAASAQPWQRSRVVALAAHGGGTPAACDS